MHGCGAYHLDLKLANLFLTRGYVLKIGDFDRSYVIGDDKINSRGTELNRAPEIADGKCHDPAAADAYSCGVILFMLKTGHYPHNEDTKVKGKANLFGLLNENPEEFWDFHRRKLKKKNDYFDDYFKAIVEGLL